MLKKISKIIKSGVRQSGGNWCIVGFEDGTTALVSDLLYDVAVNNVGAEVEVEIETSKSADGKYDNNRVKKLTVVGNGTAPLMQNNAAVPSPAQSGAKIDIVWSYTKDIFIALINSGKTPAEALSLAVIAINEIRKRVQ